MDFRRMILTFEVKRKSNLASNDYDIDLFKSNVDSCNLAKGIVGNYLINFILSGLDEHSNLVFKCPMRKGIYFIYNFPVPKQVQDFLPKFIPASSQNSAWIIMITVRANIQKTASVRVFHLKVQGLTVLND